MSRLAWGAALVLLLSVSLLVSAPARLLNLMLSADQVVMTGFDGTLWHGSASRCLVRVGPGYLHLGEVQWSLDPLSLLLLAPRLTLGSAWGRQTIEGELVLRTQQDMDLYNLEVQVAADLLRQFAPVSLTGTLSAQVSQLQLREGLVHSGSGRLVWQSGAWQAPRGPVPLGTYALDFATAEEGMLQGQVVTIAGPVEAAGDVQLQGRAYQLDIMISSQGELEEQLQQALSLIAAPEAQGYRAKLNAEF